MKLKVNIVADNEAEQQLLDRTINREYYLNRLGQALITTVVKFFCAYSKVDPHDVYVGIKVGE